MSVEIRIQVNEKLYLRDPQETRLGRSILQYGILLMEELGLEEFTFKKLAAKIDSTEASIYRYFENKHLLLVYLLCWYWERVRYQISVTANNIANPEDRLRIVIAILAESSRENPAVDYIDESVLFKIVLTEGTKTYHTKHVDDENKRGFFAVYKALAADIADILREINPAFPYPRSLAATLLEMANFHIYASRHLPSLTEARTPDGDLEDVKKLLEHFAFGLIKCE